MLLIEETRGSAAEPGRGVLGSILVTAAMMIGILRSIGSVS